MNQPKFKFGDNVWFPGRRDHAGCVYEIEGILLYKDSISYFLGGMSDSPVHESHLALCKEEPKKKKLYAYAYEDQIFFAKTDAKWLNAGQKHEAHRCPEYDIEYPEEK